MPDAPDRLALVTGTSSGIGEALARELLRRGWRVAGAARRPAAIESPLYTHLQLDLGDVAALVGVVEARLGGLLPDPALKRLALVNNAADPGFLGPVAGLDAARLAAVYAVNVAAPIALMGWLVRRGARPGVVLRIVNVSSRAALDPFLGLAAYGSSKAALRLAGQVLAAELGAGTPELDAAILSYEPGIVDTEMQAKARGSSAETLPMVERFVRFHQDGLLSPPAAPAAEIADYLEGAAAARFAERRFGDPA